MAATIDLMRTIDPDNAITSDPEVARSEMLTGQRNSAIAHVLAEHHRLTNGIDKVLAQYFAQSAITATATTVAKAALFLATAIPPRLSTRPRFAASTPCY